MPEELVGEVYRLMEAGRFSEALTLLEPLLREHRGSWNLLYMAGQCYRFTGDMPRAVHYLEKAARGAPEEPPVHLALGIALQLMGRYPEAVSSFAAAIHIDPDYELAYNSLAMTQKLSGQLDKALHNYDAGAKALARRICRQLVNDRNGPVAKMRPCTDGIWLEYALYGAKHISTLVGSVERITWPTAEQAQEEERFKRHGGLYWASVKVEDGRTTLKFLPNYFNTFYRSLLLEQSYCHLIGNRGTVLELLGRHDEAQAHFREARQFMRKA